MKVIFDGTPEEISALMMLAQGQRPPCTVEFIDRTLGEAALKGVRMSSSRDTGAEAPA